MLLWLHGQTVAHQKAVVTAGVGVGRVVMAKLED